MKAKDFKNRRKNYTVGGRSCAGCGFPLILRGILGATDDPLVVGSATGCMEVISTIYPYTAWNIPFIHSAFENVSATISGVETAYRALKKKGHKLVKDKNIKFVAFGGDGGSYDIGLQSLSGALERGHNFLYVCYDNEAYMNTGIQRSGASPLGSATTTDPAGKVSFGKKQFRKDLTKIAVAHNIPYVAQASVNNFTDLTNKAAKAFATEGPAFMNVFSPCPPGWRHHTKDTIKIAELAVKTNFWPLFEVENGQYKITYQNRKPIPVDEFLKTQGRFRHLFKKEGGKEVIQKLQGEIDKRWKELEKQASLC